MEIIFVFFFFTIYITYDILPGCACFIATGPSLGVMMRSLGLVWLDNIDPLCSGSVWCGVETRSAEKLALAGPGPESAY